LRLPPPCRSWPPSSSSRAAPVRDLAYDVEDILQDFVLRSDDKASRWCVLRTLWERRGIIKGVKELKARVEDVSSRNLRYRLVKDASASKTGAASSFCRRHHGQRAERHRLPLPPQRHRVGATSWRRHLLPLIFNLWFLITGDYLA
jgi:hypothetical protein